MLLVADFKSAASTSFATLARGGICLKLPGLVQLLRRQHHAAEHFAGAQILDGAVGLVERPFVHRWRGDGALAHERDEFARFVEAADIGADDREWLQG